MVQLCLLGLICLDILKEAIIVNSGIQIWSATMLNWYTDLEIRAERYYNSKIKQHFVHSGRS